MTHLEILIEDISGKTALENILRKFIPEDVTFNIIAYRGIGHLPSGLRTTQDPKKRILLEQLPRLISGYGKAFSSDPEEYRRHVVVVCDLDNRDRLQFAKELEELRQHCRPAPSTIFVMAIEEGEAWLLGDSVAVLEAYPKCKQAELISYVPDSICGTWEKLADAVVPGGARNLKTLGFRAIGAAKSEWAANIAPRIVLERNVSPSFKQMVSEITGLFS